MRLGLGKQASEKAQKRIEDWLTECQWAAQARRALDDVTRLGTGILKGPFPEKRTQTRVTLQGIEIREEIKPASKRAGRSISGSASRTASSG